jgi:hypothetical protein
MADDLGADLDQLLTQAGQRPRIKEGKGAIKWTRLSCRYPTADHPTHCRIAAQPRGIVHVFIVS